MKRTPKQGERILSLADKEMFATSGDIEDRLNKEGVEIDKFGSESTSWKLVEDNDPKHMSMLEEKMKSRK